MKKVILIALAMCLTGVFTSCGNKNDKAIDKFEKVVRKMEKTDDLTKLQVLAEQGQDVLNEMGKTIDPESLTKEQEARLTELATDYAKECAKLMGNAMEGLGALNDAVKSMNKQLENDDADAVSDAMGAAVDGLNSLLGSDDDDTSDEDEE